MRYIFRFNFSKIAAIPMAHWVVLLAFGWLCVETLIALFTPVEQIIQKAHQENLVVNSESMYIVGSNEVRGSKYKLVIEANETEYFAWYPKGTFQNYRSSIEEASKSSTVALTILVSNERSFWDRLHNQKTIYDARDENRIYYSLDDYVESYKREQREALIVAPLMISVWVIYLLYVVFAYKLISLS